MSVVRTLIGNVKGPKGDTGATGATGAQGDAATIQVGTVTTGAYGTNASVTNSGTEQDAVFDFVIPQGKPGEEVTDASNLTLNEITASSANYPTFTVQERLKGIFGKIQKFLSDLKANYVSKSMMSTSTNIGTAGQAVADAVAIKSLNDSLANLNTRVNTELMGGQYAIRTRTVGTFQITNSLGEEDFSDLFTSIYYAIATVSNVSSGQIIVSTGIADGTTVRVRCVPRSNLTDNANNSTPTVRFLVFGTLK